MMPAEQVCTYAQAEVAYQSTVSYAIIEQGERNRPSDPGADADPILVHADEADAYGRESIF